MFRWPGTAAAPDPAVLTARLRAIAGLEATGPDGAVPVTSDELPTRAPGLGRALLVLALGAVLVAGWLTWRAQGGDLTGSVVSPGVALSSGSPSAVPSGPTTTGTAQLVVQVLGAVRRPGVVHLPSGARVVDAVAAAGGVRAGSSTGLLNLARRVVDGEQIVVGAGPPGAAGASPASGAPTQVDLNIADLAALDALPGVGPVTAQRILDWRASHGGFASVEQLREVDGIGARTYARLAPLVRVDGRP